jgi:hypothetical protein
MTTCDGSTNQSWRRTSGGFVEDNTGDWCLDVVDARIDNGSAVALFSCNTTPAQTWTYSASGELINPQSRRCLDAVALAIKDCDGTAAQKWRLT